MIHATLTGAPVFVYPIEKDKLRKHFSLLELYWKNTIVLTLRGGQKFCITVVKPYIVERNKKQSSHCFRAVIPTIFIRSYQQ